MRIPQPIGTRGSLKWTQRLVNSNPNLLTDAIRAARGSDATWTIDWVSPLDDDERAEYRDAAFLNRVGQSQLAPTLQSFWPRRGPQWDALGRSTDKGVVLVEAKAHVNELSSSCAAGSVSLARISAALDATKAAFNASVSANWVTGFYQYANRLAHLQFLRESGIDATLALVYFHGDLDMNGPGSADEWASALAPVYEHLGLQPDLKNSGIVNVFIDVALL